MSYFKGHLDWMMGSKDLTNECGFQSHQMVPRYFLMHRGLTELLQETNDYNGFFHHFVQSRNLLDDDCKPLHSNDQQAEKAKRFVEVSLTSLDKHFIRWCSNKLLPSALMAERPLADCVARVIHGEPMPVYPDPPPKLSDTQPPGILDDDFNAMMDANYKAWKEWESVHLYQSEAHNRTWFNVQKFESWLRSTVKRVQLGMGNNEEGHIDTTVYNGVAKQCSSMMVDQLTGSTLDTRVFGEHMVVDLMWKMFLGTASNTQFVKRGAKEAAFV